jgi:hypothetical protein
MMKENVIKFDWEDEVLASMVLTHAGELKTAPETREFKARGRGKDKAGAQITLVA